MLQASGICMDYGRLDPHLFVHTVYFISAELSAMLTFVQSCYEPSEVRMDRWWKYFHLMSPFLKHSEGGLILFTEEMFVFKQLSPISEKNQKGKSGT